METQLTRKQVKEIILNERGLPCPEIYLAIVL